MSTIGRALIALIAEGHTPAVDADGNVDLTPSFIVPKTSLTQAVFIAPAAGTNFNVDVTFGGTFAVGDEITITVLSNDRSVQSWRKSYKHIVKAGATALADIVAAFYAKINADSLQDAPYTPTDASPVLNIAAKNDDSKGLEVQTYTNSSAGTVAPGALSGTISEGQPQDLIDKGIAPELINLAAYDTVKITYDAEAPIGSIDSKDRLAREIYWYGTPGEGTPLETLINS